jgi:hypothetical protein
MKNNLKNLLGDIAVTCIKNKINLSLVAEKTIRLNEQIECSGFFDETTLAASVNKKESEWISILIHESCHMDQFLDKKSLWVKNSDPIDSLDKWLKGENIKEKDLLKSINSAILLELDCEIRTVKKYIKYKIPFDKETYIQKANAYILSYWATYRDKKWYPFPYQNKKIYGKMPKVFLPKNEYLKNYEKYLNLYK